MRVDFTFGLKTIDGQPIEEPARPGAEATPLTLRRVAIDSLLRQFPSDGESGERKLDLYRLAREIQKHDELDLKPEQVSLLRERIAKAYFPLVVGQCWELLGEPAAPDRRSLEDVAISPNS